MPGHQGIEAGFEGLRLALQRTCILMLGFADGHIAADLIEHAAQRLFVELPGIQRQAAGHHATAQIDPRRRRHDGLMRGDHRTDGGTNTEMYIRHGRHMMVDEGQGRDVGKLLAGSVIDVIGPDMDRHLRPLEGLMDRHGARVAKTPTQSIRTKRYHCLTALNGMRNNNTRPHRTG